MQANKKLDETLNYSVVSSNSIDEIKQDWLLLERQGVQSPGQIFKFIDQWIKSFNIKSENQYFSVVKIDDQPIIIVALERQKKFGLQVLMPFSGFQVGVGAPLINAQFFSQLSEKQRANLFKAAVEPFNDIDLIFFPYVPKEINSKSELFEKLGISAPADVLYRAEFENWEQCNLKQRTRSRRKHDKQHSAKLNALGNVHFEEINASNAETDAILKTMFEQRALRFKAQGIVNPFNSKPLQEFYSKIIKSKGNLTGTLHVLRLNNEIVAIRYNIVHQNRMFCLISSMSDDKQVQSGSPGKQNLLRVMQSIFDNGTTTYDMGAGLTDEKCHWCNIKIPLRHYYIPISPFGYIAAYFQKLKKTIRFHVKNSKMLNSLFKKMRKNLKFLHNK